MSGANCGRDGTADGPRINRRLFLGYAGGLAAMAGASWGNQAWASASEQRAFTWMDAERRTNVELAVADGGEGKVALQVTRPLDAPGIFPGSGWGSLVDPRADLWLLDGELNHPRRLAILPGGAWSPCFSPGGTRLSALTLVGPGRVGVAVWELAQGTYHVIRDVNVEVSLCKFRTDESAYGAAGAFPVPRQYVWLDETSILFSDHGPEPQQSVLAPSSLRSTLRGMGWRTREGRRSVRVWDPHSPTCDAGGRLRRLCCETGKVASLYDGDVRGVSLSPDRLWLALLVATQGIPPVPDVSMRSELRTTSPFDDPMVALKLVLLGISGRNSVADIEGVRSAGNVAPSRLPLWSEDSATFAVPVRASYSDASLTGGDAVWKVTAETGKSHKWPVASALDAELLAALMVTEGLNTRKQLDSRPRDIGLDAPVGLGEIDGGAWRCGPRQVMYWSGRRLSLITPGRVLALPGEFTSVIPPVVEDYTSTSIAVRASGQNVLVKADHGNYLLEPLGADPAWSLLGLLSKAGKVIYKSDATGGTYLMLAEPRGERPHRSSLAFNTYFKDVLRPRRRMVSHVFGGGTARNGLLQLPIGHRDGERHPVIVWAYPNSVPFIDDPMARANSIMSVICPMQYLLTRGFAFFQAPFPIAGSARFEPMREAVEAVLPWLDVLDRQPEILPGQYAFFGYSNAGYVALALEALTRRFKAIAAWNTFPSLGYAELHSYAGDVALNCAGSVIQADRMYYEDPNQPYAPRPALPWKNPAEYIRNEPLFNLSRASTPLLLMEGEFDAEPTEMEEVYSILYGKGVPVELAYYWGEGHVFGSPGNIRDCWVRTERFFKKHCVGQ